jgi:hypothetical protein
VSTLFPTLFRSQRSFTSSTVKRLLCSGGSCSYFEANGHGTVIFHDTLLLRLRAMDVTKIGVSRRSFTQQVPRAVPDNLVLDRT